jgi:dTDP-4-dehydrorhamnose 3,5-epimerase
LAGSDRRVAGVEIRPLTVLADERGAVLHMLRADAPHFLQFGEIYFSLVKPGFVKAWHRHHDMVLNYAVPHGRVRLVVYDDREGSPTHGAVMEIEAGEGDYRLITIPPGTWSGFAALGGAPALVANCATLPHDPGEIDRRAADDPAIPYVWATDAR